MKRNKTIHADDKHMKTIMSIDIAGGLTAVYTPKWNRPLKPLKMLYVTVIAPSSQNLQASSGFWLFL